MSEATIDTFMEEASAALVGTEYLKCERLCMEAMEKAREAEDFGVMARIVLPLQEARRMRRQIAADAGVFICTGERVELAKLIQEHDAGCLLLTDPPYGQEDVAELRRLAMERAKYIEVWCADGEAMRAAFLEGMETLGDAVLGLIARGGDPVEEMEAILEKLPLLGDHEIAHQRLAEAARRAAHRKASREHESR